MNSDGMVRQFPFHKAFAATGYLIFWAKNFPTG